MVLSSKVAFLTCLAFVSGMCWLIKQVARPVVELPMPLVVRGPQAPGPAVTLASAAGAGVPHARPHRRFERPSPVVPLTTEPPANTAVVAAEPPSMASPVNRSVAALPPPVVDAVSEVALAARDTAAGIEPPAAPAPLALAEPTLGDAPASELDTPLPASGDGVPVAVVSDEPPHPARLLAAIAPAQSPQTAETPRGEPQGQPARHYTVRRGDTLVRIMRRHWKTDDPALLRVLVAANPRIAARADRIFPGDVLTIPPLEVARRLAARQAAPTPQVAAAANPRRSVKQVPIRWYTVRRRDSLASIARRVLKDERRWREIALLNGLRNANRLRPGERIKLPARPSDT